MHGWFLSPHQCFTGGGGRQKKKHGEKGVFEDDDHDRSSQVMGGWFFQNGEDGTCLMGNYLRSRHTRVLRIDRQEKDEDMG